MTVGDVLSRVTTRYNDSNYTRVSQTMYLKFLDDALNQLILSRPDSHVKTEVINLTEGTRQSLPTDGYNLINIYRNMGYIDGSSWTEGAPILQVDRDELDLFSSWHESTADNIVEEFAYDKRTPKTFWVSTPAGSDAYVEIDYSYGMEVKYGSLTDDFSDILDLVIPIDELFKEPIVSYMLYLLFSTDSSSLNDRQIAQQYEQSFYQSLGIEYQASELAEPKVENTRQVAQ